MEFWGVEVKAGQPLKVKPSFDNIIHLSQASLGESKKDKGHDSVPLFVKFGDQKLVLGTLITDTIPQLSFDLVFQKEFELSHNWKNGSVYFCGYQTPLPQDSSDEFDMEGSDEDEEEVEEDIPMIAAENGKGGLKVEKAKAPEKANAGKPEISAKDDSESDDSDDSMGDEMEDDSDESSDDKEGTDEDEGDSEGEDSEDEETPKKVVAKKRPTESATKTPVPAKKAKGGATPQTDGKKGGHVATPHPSKQAGKTTNDKSPKSGGQVLCKSCSKTFGSEKALESHTKAKHGTGK
ncbi:histone deacetylase HDT1-like isoform X2 [Mangifera indica]|uniref:histone deacetylase HDT1-like isoform X2 n=1 Tax=Mangifera indica TaxID=29780 RepID=UPI001CFB513A|nr:histone deacetylase HDT1-like isoform X2 [Mangifera indica]